MKKTDVASKAETRKKNDEITPQLHALTDWRLKVIKKNIALLNI